MWFAGICFFLQIFSGFVVFKKDLDFYCLKSNCKAEKASYMLCFMTFDCYCRMPNVWFNFDVQWNFLLEFCNRVYMYFLELGFSCRTLQWNECSVPTSIWWLDKRKSNHRLLWWVRLYWKWYQLDTGTSIQFRFLQEHFIHCYQFFTVVLLHDIFSSGK